MLLSYGGSLLYLHFKILCFNHFHPFLLNNFSGTVHRLTIVKIGVFIILVGNQLDAQFLL